MLMLGYLKVTQSLLCVTYKYPNQLKSCTYSTLQEHNRQFTHAAN